ncbi:sickle tail protein homolog isoform X2 [Cebidichthys violaceus]|uniref:sickle tail protein homolog isoform X2 n=1 Tax=Cebidichthys violaceus TaxID=271503 RepID=UPI0035CC4E35
MDSMLKRVKALTEALSCLRRCVSESIVPARSAQVEPLKVLETDQGPLKAQSPQSSPKPLPRSSVRAPLPTPSLSRSQAEVSHPSPPLTATHGRDSPTVAKVSPCSREGSPALQRRQGPLTSLTQDSHADHTPMEQTTERHTPEGSLGVETSSMNQTSTSQANQPASFVSSQLPSPNTNTDFDQVLQESQASLMKTITRLNVLDTREGCSDSASRQLSTASKSERDTSLDLTLQASVEQQARLSDSQEDTTPQLSDEVDSIQLEPSDTAASQLPAAPVEPPPSAPQSAAPSAPPSSSAPQSAAPFSASQSAPPSAAKSAAPSSAPPPSTSPSTERISRPRVEKPRRTSVDKEMKQSPDRAGKSPPPPPPPRRFHAVNSGLTTGRSGEVVFTTRKEPLGSQDEGEKEKEQPLVPQPKPPRQPPEVKPKPQMCSPSHLAGSTSTRSTASAHRGDVEEEEEDNKIMKELQVTTELSNKNNLSGGNKQWKEKVRTSPTSQVANLKPSQLPTSDHQSAPQTGITDGCPNKLITAAGLEEHIEVRRGNINLDKKDAEENVVKQLPSLTALQDVQTVQKNEEIPTTSQRKAEIHTAPTVQKENYLSVKSPDQINKEVVGPVCSPTSAEKKVKFTTIVTLQKENIQATDIASPDQTNEKVVNEVPAEKKSNLMVVLTLQKENTPEDRVIEFQQDKSQSSDQCVASSPVKPSPSLTYSSKQQNQEATAQVSRDQSQYTEEGSNLSPDLLDDEGPPPPPQPIGKISLRISKIMCPRLKTQFREEDLAEMSDSDKQIVAGVNSTGEPTYWAHDNQGFQDSDDCDMKPIIVFLNEPMDIQSAYKRLSTILESEEDLSPENIVDEEDTKQYEEKQNVRKISITEINTDLDLKDSTGNGQYSLHMHNQRPSADNVSICKNQDQGKPDSLRQPETKRKFKLKFPKNKLAAISQAIRTGTVKTGKKAVKVVVYEEEEENASYSNPVKETKKPTKESKRFDTSTKQFNLCEGKTETDRDIKVSPSIDTRHSKSHSRVEELCRVTFDSNDSLEESIKQLEISVDSMSGPSSPSSIVSSPPQSPDSSFDSSDRAQLKGKVKRERERSPSKRPASQILKGPNPPQSKRTKPQPLHDSGKTSTKKQTSSSSFSSSAQRSQTKSRHSSSSSSPEKTPKGQQQSPQKQPSQPRHVVIPR